jgi:hypothetical protein
MAREGVEATTSGTKSGGFYDAHSEYQRRVVQAGAAALERVVASLELDQEGEPLAIVDYGAGTGANSARAMGAAIRSIRSRWSETPIVAIHNDLPTSDFGALRLAAEGEGYLGIPGGPIYSMAATGSFFDQLVPDASVGLGMCSNAAHWYREQPHVGEFDGMYFSAARGAQRERLAAQAADDWTRFLEARASELTPGDRLLVQGIGVDGEGRVSAGRLLEQMWAVALGLSERGLLDRTVLGEYVFPVYCRSAAEAKAPMGPGGPLAEGFEVVAADSQEVATRTGRCSSEAATARPTRAPTRRSSAPSPSRRSSAGCSRRARSGSSRRRSATSSSPPSSAPPPPIPRPAATRPTS